MLDELIADDLAAVVIDELELQRGDVGQKREREYRQQHGGHGQFSSELLIFGQPEFPSLESTYSIGDQAA
jgi:hypothetical protein